MMKHILAVALLAGIAGTSLSYDAQARAPRTCPDGTVVSDSKRCPKQKLTTGGGAQRAKKPSTTDHPRVLRQTPR